MNIVGATHTSRHGGRLALDGRRRLQPQDDPIKQFDRFCVTRIPETTSYVRRECVIFFKPRLLVARSIGLPSSRVFL